MPRLRLPIFIAFSALLWGLAALATETIHWPPLGNDQEIMAYINAIEPEVPGLYESLVDYDTDPFEVMEQQARLNRELATNPRYQKDLTEWRDRTQIEITVQSGKPAGEVDPQALAKLRDEAVSLLPSHVEESLHAALRESFLREGRSYPGLSANGYLVGLLKALPPEKQKAGFSMSPEEKLRYLRENLGEEKLVGLFGSLKLELPPTRENALTVATELLKRERTLQETGLLLSLLPPQIDQVESARAYLSQLGEKDLAEIAAKESLQKRLSDSLGSATEEKILRKAVDGAAEQGRRKIKSIWTSAETSAKPPEKLLLVEKPPQLANWSGVIGSDSATKNAAAYANSPGVRTWWIYDEKGRPRGYASLAEVVENGKPALVINTINGARVKPEHADAILRGFYEARKELGAENILLPPTDKLISSFNYEDVRDHIGVLVNGKPSLPLSYPDENTREAVGKYVPRPDYNSAENNAFGVEYLPRENGSTVRAVVSKTPPFHLEAKPLSRAQALLLSLQMSALGKERISRRILASAGVEAALFHELQAKLANREGLPTAEYLKKAAATLAPYEITVDPALKQTKALPFYSGILRAPDAFAPAQRERTVTALITLLDTGTDPEAVTSLLKKHGREIAVLPKFQAYVNKLITFEDGRGLPVIWDRMRSLREAGLGIHHFPDAEKRLLEIAASPNYFYHDYYLKLAGSGILLENPDHLEKAARDLFTLQEVGQGDERVEELLRKLAAKDPFRVKALAEGAAQTEGPAASGARQWLSQLRPPPRGCQQEFSAIARQAH